MFISFSLEVSGALMVHVESNVARSVGHTFVLNLNKLDETLAADKHAILQMETRFARLADTSVAGIAAFEAIEDCGYGSEFTEAEMPADGAVVYLSSYTGYPSRSAQDALQLADVSTDEILCNEKEKDLAPDSVVHETESGEEDRRKFIPGNRVFAQHQGKWYDAIVLARNDRRGFILVRTIALSKLSWFPMGTTRIKRMAALEPNAE